MTPFLSLVASLPLHSRLCRTHLKALPKPTASKGGVNRAAGGGIGSALRRGEALSFPIFLFLSLHTHSPHTLSTRTLPNNTTMASVMTEVGSTRVYERGLVGTGTVNKITNIEWFNVRPRWLFVRVETEKGIIGWGGE